MSPKCPKCGFDVVDFCRRHDDPEIVDLIDRHREPGSEECCTTGSIKSDYLSKIRAFKNRAAGSAKGREKRGATSKEWRKILLDCVVKNPTAAHKDLLKKLFYPELKRKGWPEKKQPQWSTAAKAATALRTKRRKT